MLALRRRPTGAGAKPPCGALAEDRRAERQGKRRGLTVSGGDQEDVPEALGSGSRWVSLLKRRKCADGIETGGHLLLLGMSLAGARVLARWCPA